MKKTKYLPPSSLMDWTTENLRGAESLLLTDCDLIVRSRPTQRSNKTCLMLLEIKAKGANIKQHQRFSFSLLNIALNKINNTTVTVEGFTTTIEYFGFHLLQFSNTDPSNSEEIRWDNQIISESTLIDNLNFGCCSYCF